jgi:hypothetical protein
MTIADNVRNADRVRRQRSPGRYVSWSTPVAILSATLVAANTRWGAANGLGWATSEHRQPAHRRCPNSGHVQNSRPPIEGVRDPDNEISRATDGDFCCSPHCAVVEILDAFDDALFASPREDPRLVARPAGTERRAGRPITRDTATMFRAVRRWTRPAKNATRRRVPWRRLSPRTARRPQPGQERASPVMRGSRQP